MTSDKPKRQTSKQSGQTSLEEAPEWTDSLRELYDSVVDEELPDSFKDLLAKLDNDS